MEWCQLEALGARCGPSDMREQLRIGLVVTATRSQSPYLVPCAAAICTICCPGTGVARSQKQSLKLTHHQCKPEDIQLRRTVIVKNISNGKPQAATLSSSRITTSHMQVRRHAKALQSPMLQTLVTVANMSILQSS